MVRTVWGIVAGGVVGIVAMRLIGFVGDMIFPVPAGLDISRPGASASYIDKMPLLSLLPVIIGWAAGSYIAAMVATRVARTTSMLPGLIAGAVPLLAGVLEMAMIPHPIWMWGLGLIALTAPAYFAARQFMPRPATLRDAM